MVEKKENSKKIDLKSFEQYFDIIKKYCSKLLNLDPQTYFLIVPGILLLIGLLPVPDIYFAILRIYLFVISRFFPFNKSLFPFFRRLFDFRVCIFGLNFA